MKRIYVSILTFLTAVFCVFAFTGCQKQVTAEGDYVVIVAEDVAADTTLLSYMETLQEDGKLTFESQDSDYGAYVTSINGKEQESSMTSGYSWMLYTSDSENASTDFASFEYEGEVYGQASLGASSLIVKEGAYYIWVYEAWSA